MNLHSLSRRSILKAGGALVGAVAMPAVVRADPKEIVVGGPAGAAKYFNADLFPVLEKKLDIKILYEGQQLAHQPAKDARRQGGAENVGRHHGRSCDDPRGGGRPDHADVAKSHSQSRQARRRHRSIATACGRTIRSRGRASPSRRQRCRAARRAGPICGTPNMRRRSSCHPFRILKDSGTCWSPRTWKPASPMPGGAI